MSERGIKCGKCKSYHPTTAEVRACYRAGARPARKIVDGRHLEMINKGMAYVPAEHALSDDQFARALRAQVASAPASAPAQAPTSAAPATEGMYVLDGRIYKVVVAVHGSGRLYAQRLVGTSFQAEPGAIRKLTQAHRMTPEAAAEFGHLYGRCVRCQATLTDDKSIKAGIGPVCATKV